MNEVFIENMSQLALVVTSTSVLVTLRSYIKSRNESEEIEKKYKSIFKDVEGLSKEKILQMKAYEIERYKQKNKFNLYRLITLSIASLGIFFSITFFVNNIRESKNLVVENTYYRDNDLDGYGDPNNFLVTSKRIWPQGYINNSQDTDDSDTSRYIEDKVWYLDKDGDGYGLSEYTKLSYKKPLEYAFQSGDIDDNDKNRTLKKLDREIFLDNDNDGFGDSDFAKYSSILIEGYVYRKGDFDDDDSNVYPGQIKYFDRPSKGKKIWDYNCDGKIEHQFTQTGRCKGGTAKPQGWQNNIPSCGNSARWLIDCDRKISFPATFRNVEETIIKRQACR